MEPRLNAWCLKVRTTFRRPPSTQIWFWCMWMTQTWANIQFVNVDLKLSFLVFLFRPHRNTTYVDAAYCYRPSRVVCRSVCQSVTVVSPANRLNRSRCRLISGLMWAECSDSDAALCQINLTTCVYYDITWVSDSQYKWNLQERLFYVDYRLPLPCQRLLFINISPFSRNVATR